MAEKELGIKEKLDMTGIFNFRGLYSFAHNWLKEAKYGVDEEKYAEKQNGNKKDIDIEWKAMKNVSDYFKFEHKIKFEIKNLVEVEAEIDGEKKKMNQGIVKIEFSGNLIRDRDSKWDTSPFARFMRDIYNKYVIQSRIEELRREVGNDIRNFKEELKAFFEMSGRR